MRAYTNDALVSPVTEQEFADWQRLDDTLDPTIAPLLLTATQAVIDWIQRDLLPRNWVLVHEHWPSIGKDYKSLAPSEAPLKREIELLYGGTTAITDVMAYGELVDSADYRLIDDLPSLVKFNHYFTYKDDAPALVINYTNQLGATAADIPDVIKSAVKMVAGFIYDHRGGCDTDEALTKSGAKTLLQPWRVGAGTTL